MFYKENLEEKLIYSYVLYSMWVRLGRGGGLRLVSGNQLSTLHRIALKGWKYISGKGGGGIVFLKRTLVSQRAG